MNIKPVINERVKCNKAFYKSNDFCREIYLSNGEIIGQIERFIYDLKLIKNGGYIDPKMFTTLKITLLMQPKSLKWYQVLISYYTGADIFLDSPEEYIEHAKNQCSIEKSLRISE